MKLDRYCIKPIYLQLAEKLHADIASGIYSPDSQLPTEKTLSREFDVSVVTIRSTFKKLENEGRIYRLRGKGTFVSPAQKKQKVLIVVLSMPAQGHNSLQSLMAGAFMRTQEEHGQLQLIPNEQLKKTIETVKNNPTLQAGVIFLRDDNMTADSIKLVEDAGMPLIVEGRTVQGSSYQDIDNYDAMKKVTEHLLALGHRRFGLLMLDSIYHNHFSERHRAVIETLKEQGIDFDGSLQFTAPDDTPDAGLYTMTEKFFKVKKPPTAIISVTDRVAVEIILWLNHHHYKVPEQVSVTGFDDSDFAKYADPSLTTVRQDYFSLGYTAADSVFQMMNNYINRKIQRKVKLELIVRKSTGPVISNRRSVVGSKRMNRRNGESVNRSS